jgi:hypothetical protein
VGPAGGPINAQLHSSPRSIHSDSRVPTITITNLGDDRARAEPSSLKQPSEAKEGCGRHVASVHAQIPEGQHCACRDWPGVAPPPVEKKAADAGKTSAGSATAAEDGSAGSAAGGAAQ